MRVFSGSGTGGGPDKPVGSDGVGAVQLSKVQLLNASNPLSRRMVQVVDLTSETARMASRLSEAHLRCDERQRDELLYYLLVRTPLPEGATTSLTECEQTRISAAMSARATSCATTSWCG